MSNTPFPFPFFTLSGGHEFNFQRQHKFNLKFEFVLFRNQQKYSGNFLLLTIFLLQKEFAHIVISVILRT